MVCTTRGSVYLRDKRFSSPPKCRPVLEPTRPGLTLEVFFCEVKQPGHEADPLAFSE